MTRNIQTHTEEIARDLMTRAQKLYLAVVLEHLGRKEQIEKPVAQQIDELGTELDKLAELWGMRPITETGGTVKMRLKVDASLEVNRLLLKQWQKGEITLGFLLNHSNVKAMDTEYTTQE